jgi:hypothetical protein
MPIGRDEIRKSRESESIKVFPITLNSSSGKMQDHTEPATLCLLLRKAIGKMLRDCTPLGAG